MAVANQIQRVSYAGDGTTTGFTFGGLFYNQADLVVIVKDNTTGVETLQTITTHYTVSGEGNEAGGEVTFLSAPATGETVVIYRDPQLLQPTVFEEGGALPAKEIERSDDRAVLMSQRNADIAKRALRLTDGFTASFNPVLPETLGAGVTIVVNPAADGFEEGPTAGNIAGAEANAIAAAASETAAGISAAAAAASETAAGISEAAAAASETAAGISEVAAGLSEAAAAASETAAGISEANADASAIAAAASETAAGLSEVAAAASETAAGLSEAAATAAAAQLEAAFYRDVVHVDSGDSPLAITSADNGKLFLVDASGGAVGIDMPEISALAGPFNVSVKLAVAGNLVTIYANVADTIGGEASRNFSRAEESLHLVADKGPTPDNWVVLDFSGAGAGSGAGGINHISEPSANFEGSQLGDWELYVNTTPGATPTLNALGTPNVNVTFEASGTDPLRGEYSGLLEKDAADRQGHGVRIPFTIHNQDRANGSLYVSFDLETSANYVADDVLPFIWNSTTNEVVELKRAGSSGRFIGSFTPQAASGYQLALHIATTNASAYTVKVDNFIVGPDKLLNGIFKRSVVLNAAGVGDFTGGTVRVSRVGNLCSVSVLTALTYSSASGPSSGNGFIPDWARPTATETNITVTSSTLVYQLSVTTGGSLVVLTRDWSGTATATTSFLVNGVMSYTVEDTGSDLLSTTGLLNQSSTFRVSRVAAMDITGSATTIVYDTVQKANSNFELLGSGKVKVLSSGRYVIQAGTQVSLPNTSNARVQNTLVTPDRSFILNTTHGGGGSTSTGEPITALVDLSANDEIEMRSTQNHGTDQPLAVGSSSWLSIVKIPDFSVFGATSLGSLIGYHVIDTVGANTYTKNPLAKKIRTIVQAGGGAGGAGANTSSGQMSNGGGGAGGGTSIKVIDNDEVLSSTTVTVGAGGAGSAGSNGGGGGTSSFGSHCSATGGAGGNGSTAAGTQRTGATGNGGVGSGGNLNYTGGQGDMGYSEGGSSGMNGFGFSGRGGPSFFGGGGGGKTALIANASIQGGPGGAYGAGGGGTVNGDGATASAGGNGGQGVCIVEEYA